MEPEDLEPIADQADLAEQGEEWGTDDVDELDGEVVPDPERVEPVDEER